MDDLIELAAAVDGILQLQAKADADYFLRVCGRSLTQQAAERVQAGILKAYRWQYIVSGVQDPRFSGLLGEMITAEQGRRIGAALAPIVSLQ